jgi:hypothetical protein
MPTAYPATLPAVPEDRWRFIQLPWDDYYRETGPNGAAEQAVTSYLVEAPDAPTAELRVMAVIGEQYREGLRGGEADAVEEHDDRRWRVELSIPIRFPSA